MNVCPNCKAKLSCGCQRRKASNGTQVCSNCLANYEAQIKSKPIGNNIKKSTK